MKQGRDAAIQRLQGVFASGGTALYDAIAEAYDHQLELVKKRPGQISAVVVLTDGEDTDSRLKLGELLQRIRSDSETRTIRVFTIGYGKDARRGVLERIADATQARFYVGTPENIRTVFREISTFF